MDTHDHSAYSQHVVTVGEGDESYGGQVMDKHDEEILSEDKGKQRNRGIDRGRQGGREGEGKIFTHMPFHSNKTHRISE